MKNIFAIALLGFWLIGCNEVPTTDQVVDAVEGAVQTTPAPAEFADPALAEVGKKFHSTFSAKNIDGWMEDFADEALFVWSSGDSLVGKQAISDYWKDRFTRLQSITFSQDIWLPIKVNQPQANEPAGNYLLGWYRFDATYSNGKSVGEFAHDVIHFNEAGKIDAFYHYVDMAPIKEAMM